MQFIIEDDQSNVAQSVASYQRLADQVNIVVGPYSSTATGAILDADTDGGTILFAPTFAATGLSARSQWLFRTSLSVANLVLDGIAISKQIWDTNGLQSSSTRPKRFPGAATKRLLRL